MRDYTQFRVGTDIPGNLIDLRNKVVTFDGRAPHGLLPFQRTRVSVVYFTRNKWLTLREEDKRRTQEVGFPTPGPEWMAEGGFPEDAPEVVEERIPNPKRMRLSHEDQVR